MVLKPKYLSFRRWLNIPCSLSDKVVGSLGYVVVSNIFHFHPYLGKWSNLTLTNIFFQMGRNPPTNTGAAAICGDNYRNLKWEPKLTFSFWNTGGLEDKPFLLGYGLFSGAMLVLGIYIYIWWLYRCLRWPWPMKSALYCNLKKEHGPKSLQFHVKFLMIPTSTTCPCRYHRVIVFDLLNHQAFQVPKMEVLTDISCM